MSNCLKTTFFTVFQIKKSRYGREEVRAVRITQKKPTKVKSSEFFTKFTVSVPKGYLKKPEPSASLELTEDVIGDFPRLVAEKLRT